MRQPDHPEAGSSVHLHNFYVNTALFAYGGQWVYVLCECGEPRRVTRAAYERAKADEETQHRLIDAWGKHAAIG